MKRVEAQRLALVNWNGIFYQRFLLDRERRVTALAGDNGAGKTTIMIGAYVVLMPDMGRLRFTNLGASATTGGDRGIWGRLGEPGAPSYAALDFDIPGEGRLVAVVRLERKGEPSVELTSMTIEGLGPDVILKDLFVAYDGGMEVVVDQQGLRANTTRAGGTLKVHDSIGKYFAVLYEKGIMPLRMATEEDRTRFNEMLRTSMQGGMSSRILQDLGKFLLQEETRLVDSLVRMRENLDSCRRTRTEVQESQRLEREISEIYDFGNAMFAAAYLMTKKRAEEYEQRLRDAEEEAAAARTALGDAEKRYEEAKSHLTALEDESKQLKDDIDKERELVSALKNGLVIKERLEVLQEDERKTRKEQERASAELSLAREAEEKALERLQRTSDALNRAVQGLADFQNGLDELQWKAARHRQAMKSLETARSCLAPELSPDTLHDDRARAITERDRSEELRREKERIQADAERHAVDFAAAVQALELLSGACIIDHPPYNEAQEALRLHQDRIGLATSLPSLCADLENSRKFSQKQREIRGLASELEIKLGPSDSPTDIVRRRHQETNTKLEISQRDQLNEEQIARTLDAKLTCFLRDRESIEAMEPRWQTLMKAAERVAGFTGGQLSSEEELARARSLLKASIDEATKERDRARERHETYLSEIRHLSRAGGPFSPELLRIKEELGADLFATQFENLPLAEAARIEALLGDRALALVVPNPLEAASMLSNRDVETLPQVHLIAENHDEGIMEEDVFCASSSDVAVWESDTLRVSRVPERPVLGRRAREARIEELKKLIEEESACLDAAGKKVFTLTRLIGDADELLKGLSVWLGPSPNDERKRVELEMEEVRTAAMEARDRSRQLAINIVRLKKEEEALATILSNAALLGAPDHAARMIDIEVAITQAHEAEARVRADEDACRVLERLKDDLRRLPLEPDGLKKLADEVKTLRDQRVRLNEGIEALQELEGNVEALGWTGYEKVLKEKQEIRPELERLHNQAKADHEEAANRNSVANKQRLKMESTDQEIRNQLSSILKRIEEERSQLQKLGVGEPSKERLYEAQMFACKLEHRLSETAESISQENQKLGAAGQDINAGRVRVEKAEASLLKERGEADPARLRSEELENRTRAAGYDSGLFIGSAAGLKEIGGSINLGQEADRLFVRLQERSKMVRQEADSLMTILSRQPRERNGETFGLTYFGIWTEVRGWIIRRLPLEISEGDDPREMLELLKERLAAAEAQLVRQEKLLRGTGEDIANGIKVRIRKERSKTERLNRELEGIRFGGISGIRIKTVPVDEMAQILSGLETGSLQNALFGEDIPFEEALDRIFEKYGGGKGSAGGHKVLDYREYIHLQVEFRRVEKEQWEIADTGKLSTGEAIGVGAALMMVILGAWEGDEVLFRGKRQYGSLRFLFLDEANRLDQRSLGVLFDLCAIIGLQLIVAAPEVALSEGNITHQIVPTYLKDGRRKVQVFSRRRVQQAT